MKIAKEWFTAKKFIYIYKEEKDFDWLDDILKGEN